MFSLSIETGWREWIGLSQDWWGETPGEPILAINPISPGSRGRSPHQIDPLPCWKPVLPFFQRSFSPWIFAGSFTPSWSRVALA
jgi:hypothetical protein